MALINHPLSFYLPDLKCKCGAEAEIAWDSNHIKRTLNTTVNEFGVFYLCRNCARRMAMALLRDVAELQVGYEKATAAFEAYVEKYCPRRKKSK